MKKRWILILIIFLAIVGCSIYLYIRKDNNSVSISIKKNAIQNIDWSSYKDEEIVLSNSIEITEEGVYYLTGTIKDGYIFIYTKGNVKLVLNNVSITNSSGPAIYIEDAKNVEINTLENTTNTLSDGSSYADFEDKVNACIYSKDDLILSGEGLLKVNGNYADGIVSKDNLLVTGGSYYVTAKNNGIKGKDSVEITGGSFDINTIGDAITATNDTDEGMGYVAISGGSFTVKTTGNTVNTSSKGIKAETAIEITGGSFDINSADDGIHTNGNISIDGGDINVESKDDAIHADGLIEINGGELNIVAAEGIEATYVKITGGTINIEATDDGINAGNKSDDYKVTIEITGGTITIKMGPGDTDGIDSNGDLYITGGTIDVTANSPFDYDGELKHTGGTIIANGEETNEITNQTMGGAGMGNMPPEGDMRGMRRMG